MKKLAIAAVIFAVLQAYGSTVMIVHSSNGSRDVYQLSDVQKMAFTDVKVGVLGNLNAAAANTFSLANTSLKLSIGKTAMVGAKLFSCNGRVYGVAPCKQYNPGSYVLPLDKNFAIAKGVYILQVTIDGRISNQKMVVAR